MLSKDTKNNTELSLKNLNVNFSKISFETFNFFIKKRSLFSFNTKWVKIVPVEEGATITEARTYWKQ